jgi:hypothetical protein
MRAKASAALLTLQLWVAKPLVAQLPGSLGADRARLAEITRDSTVAFRNREVPLGDLLPPLLPLFERSGLDLRAALPELRTTWNSAIPYSLNDGAMWAGRGHNISLSGGISAERRTKYGLFLLRIAPTLLYNQNLPFQVRPDSTAGRSAYASPFHHLPFSADLPQRFGDRHLIRLDPGESALAVSTASMQGGISTGNEAWGPGIRNQLVMSANAAGIPRFFLGTSSPLRTGFGSIRAKLIAGALTESMFFDATPGNDLRSVSGALVELVPAFDSTLTFGLERVVYRPIGPLAGPLGAVLARSFDALVHWEYVAPPGDDRPDGSPDQRADQITALFARWISPESGFEVYGEWARLDLPKSLGELLTAAHHSLGYTIGFQWAPPRRRAHRYLRLQSEFTNLEQSRVFADRPPADFYTSRVAGQGYTQRGQVVGAAIGPGASSQWIAVDYIAPHWQLGSYVGRIRWENDAMYREPVPHLFLHDVTVLTGLRAARRTRGADVSIDATFGYRFNYLFQNGIPQPGGFGTVDVRNFTLSTTVTPRWSSLRPVARPSTERAGSRRSLSQRGACPTQSGR